MEKWQTERDKATQAVAQAEYDYRSKRRGTTAPWHEVEAAKKAVGKAERELARIMDEKAAKITSKVFGARIPASVDMADYTHPVTTAARDRSKNTEKWAQQMSMTLERAAVDQSGARLKFALEELPERAGGRAYQDSGAVYLPEGGGRRQAIHEIAHALEYNNPKIHRAAEDFLEQRTKGEQAESLRTLTGRAFGREEVAKKDRFPDPYCGKIYSPGMEGGQGATEIVSMGMQYFFMDPLKFWQDDAGYFKFIVDILSGAIK
jgi:hypothetical protein